MILTTTPTVEGRRIAEYHGEAIVSAATSWPRCATSSAAARERAGPS